MVIRLPCITVGIVKVEVNHGSASVFLGVPANIFVNSPQTSSAVSSSSFSGSIPVIIVGI